MAFHKCPRCELNYITDDEKLCSVCRREVKGEPDHDVMPEMCSECGERPVVPGSEYCLLCLKEMSRRNATTAVPAGDTEEHSVDSSTLDIGMVSSMDEIQIDDMDDEIPQHEFAEMASEFGSDDDEEEEENDEDDDEGGEKIPGGRKRSRKPDSDGAI